MLAISNLSKSFGLKTVLDHVAFTLKSGERMALVGPNGCGKTTLMRIIAGLEKADGGSIRITPSNISIAYLPQGFEDRYQSTMGEYLDPQGFDLPTLEARFEEVAALLTQAPFRDDLHKEYNVLLNKIIQAGDGENDFASALSAFGLGNYPKETRLAHLSGGQKTRLALARIISSKPDLLLLDEPTNHLDIEMLEWLEQWLTDMPITVLFISHDRSFLDHVATSILEVDPVTKKVHEYPGNYSAYLNQKQIERDHQLQEFTDQQDEIVRLTRATAHLRDLAQFHKGGKADTGDKFAKGFFANRGMETIRRARSLEKKIDHFQTDGAIEKPRQSWQMKIEFSGMQPSGKDVCLLDQLCIGYQKAILISNIQLVIRNHQRVVMVGANGSGKTTLLRTIADQIPPIGGTVHLGANVKIGFMAQEQLDNEKQGNPLIRIGEITGSTETEVRSFLSKYLFRGDDVFTPCAKMSYGERSRLALASLVAQGTNFLLLDEPINHLDIPARIKFETALKEFEGTILAVIHDRYFIQSFATNIWEVKDGGIRIIA